MLPVMVFAGYLGVVSAREQRQAIQNGMQETACALSLGVDRQVGIAAASLEALFSSSAFRRARYRRGLDPGGTVLHCDDSHFKAEIFLAAVGRFER
jgi:hypothetical protein